MVILKMFLSLRRAPHNSLLAACYFSEKKKMKLKVQVIYISEARTLHIHAWWMGSTSDDDRQHFHFLRKSRAKVHCQDRTQRFSLFSLRIHQTQFKMPEIQRNGNLSIAQCSSHPDNGKINIFPHKRERNLERVFCVAKSPWQHAHSAIARKLS